MSRDAAFPWVSLGTHKLEDFDASTAGERALVAEYSRDLIGFASAWQDDSFSHNLLVHPRHQGLGIGKMLLTGCNKYFPSFPTLKCLKANESAKLFYQSQGGSVRSEAEGPEGPYILMERVSPNNSFKPNLPAYAAKSA